MVLKEHFGQVVRGHERHPLAHDATGAEKRRGLSDVLKVHDEAVEVVAQAAARPRKGELHRHACMVPAHGFHRSTGLEVAPLPLGGAALPP